jgi:hypothetical protein
MNKVFTFFNTPGMADIFEFRGNILVTCKEQDLDIPVLQGL